jgi:outer membrane protein
MDNTNTTLSLQLNIPIFNRLQTTSAIYNAKINVEKKRLQLESIKKKILLEVQTAYNDACASLHEYHGNIRAHEASKESFRYTEEKFNVGMVSPVDYHNGKNLLSKAESDVLQAKYRYFLRKSMLEILCGKGIPFDMQ